MIDGRTSAQGRRTDVIFLWCGHCRPPSEPRIMLIGFVGRHDIRCFSVATASPRIEHQGWKIQRSSPCFSIIS
ncbi:hypothetical protein B4113_4042 [Geobacillus sp. B4113_201601]|nr:hypothetical protein B4113_4042 [Geobacillus sp. B4113_201601]